MFQRSVAIGNERFLEPKKQHSRHSFLLVYPNSYRVGMSCLGFHQVLSIVDSVPDWHSERAFFGMSRSLESGRSFGAFDVVAFSVSYELDFISLPAILAAAGLPARARLRGEGYPLVLAGGAALTVNPEPAADFLDLVIPGEAEETLPALLERIVETGGLPRTERLRALARVAGVYVPGGYRLAACGESIQLLPRPGYPPVISTRVPDSLERFPAYSRVLTPETVFPNRVLVEIARGCKRRCRFCAASHHYLPPRRLRAETVLSLLRPGADSFGLIAPAVSDHPEIEDILEGLTSSGASVSVSSLRVETVTPRLLSLLVAGGQRTLTLAPEAGSARLRRLINKEVSGEHFLEVLDQAARAGLRRGKLYFLIGLPGEEREDLDQLAGLAEAAAAIIPTGVSISPFVPKPGTPFQWLAQAPRGRLKASIRFLRSRLSRTKNLKMDVTGAREAFRQAIIDRGDRRLGELLESGDWRNAAELFPPDKPPPSDFAWRPVFDGMPTTDSLREEFRRFQKSC